MVTDDTMCDHLFLPSLGVIRLQLNVTKLTSHDDSPVSMGSEHFKCSESLVSVRSGLDVTLDQKRARFQRVTLPHIPWIKAPARHK